MALGSVGFYVAIAFTLFLPLLFALILKKTRHPFPIAIMLLVFFWWVFAFILPNVFYLFSPTTPPIKGRVTDPAGKPLAGVNVKAAWIIRLAGGSPKPYKVINTTSNERGEFQIPKAFKSLNFFWGAPIFYFWDTFEGIKVIAYTYDYKFYEHEFEYHLGKSEPKEISQFRDGREYVVALQSFMDDKEYLENIDNIDTPLIITNIPQFKITPFEKDFIVRARRLFEEKYPDSTNSLKEHNLLRLSGTLGHYGDHKEEIKVLRELAERFPKSSDFAEKEIKKLKKIYGLQGGDYAK